LWLHACTGSHMVVNCFPSDAGFLDSKERVRKVYRKLPQWWVVGGFVWGARSVLELPAGSTVDIDLQPGDQIVIS